MLPIYLDHHATTPLDPRVAEAMRPYFSEEFGNPSSHTHAFGWRAEDAVEQARARIAAAIGARDPSEIYFTSGTTESDNLALKGVLRAAPAPRDQIVTTRIEHPAVLESCRALEAEGYAVEVLPVDAEGLVDPHDVGRAIGPRTALVSVMAANGEIGTVQPLEEIARVCRERGVPLHTDAAQAVGRLPLDVDALGVDLLSMCAHKLYGPKGIGVLYVRARRPPLPIAPLLHGGGHERGLRAGTLAVPLVVGFARALELCLDELEAETERLSALRDRLWAKLRDGLGGVRINGHAARRLPGNLNVSFEGVRADRLLLRLKDEVALSTGSACASASPVPSHVLAALGLSRGLAAAAVRVGIGRGNDTAQVDWVAERLCRAVSDERAIGDPTPAGSRYSPSPGA